MKTTHFTLLLFGIITCCISCHQNDEEKIMTISKSEVENKIMGGWAGQVIGCTYGGPTEFRFNGTMIQDYVPIPWDNTRCLWYFENFPGLYDDIYMDLTFVDVFEKKVSMLQQARMHWHLQKQIICFGMPIRQPVITF